MSEILKFPKRIDGLSAADRRAIALHEWMADRTVSAQAIKDEMARLRRMIPDEE